MILSTLRGASRHSRSWRCSGADFFSRTRSDWALRRNANHLPVGSWTTSFASLVWFRGKWKPCAIHRRKIRQHVVLTCQSGNNLYIVLWGSTIIPHNGVIIEALEFEPSCAPIPPLSASKWKPGGTGTGVGDKQERNIQWVPNQHQ